MERNPREMWLENLQRQHQSSSRPGAPVSNISRAAASNAPFLSTPQYVRQAAAASGNMTTPASAIPTYPSARSSKPSRVVGVNGSSPRSSHPTKDREALAEEVLELKKKIVRMTEDGNVAKAKTRRLEEENKHKEKQLESLLDPSRSDEMRRTLGDRKADSASVIASLKQRIFKLEQSLKDKESALQAVQKDIKSTSTHELKVQMETMYQEILRLRKVNQVVQASAAARAAFAEEAAAPSSKMKALNNAILRLHTENQDIGKESLGLKADLEVALNDNETLKDALAAERQQASSHPSSAEAEAALQRTETENNRLKKQVSLLQDEVAKLLAQEKQKSNKKDEDEDDNENKAQLRSLTKALAKFKKRRADETSASAEDETGSHRKMTLSGNWIECLDALDLRESELLEEIEKSKTNLKKAKDDKMSWKKKAAEADLKAVTEAKAVEEARDEIEELRRKCERLEVDLANATKSRTPRERHPSETSQKGRSTPSRANTPPSRPATASRSSTPTRPSSTKPKRGGSASPLPPVTRKAVTSPPPSEGDDDDDEKEEEERKNEERRHQREEEEERRQKEEERRRRRRRSRERAKKREQEENAAFVIQRQWKGHKRRKEEEEERVTTKDLLIVQSALRAHAGREGEGEEESREEENAALALQSAMRGHMARTSVAEDAVAASRPASRERLASRSRSPVSSGGGGGGGRKTTPPSRLSTPRATNPSNKDSERLRSESRGSKNASPRPTSTSKTSSRRNTPDDDGSTDDDADVMF